MKARHVYAVDEIQPDGSLNRTLIFDYSTLDKRPLEFPPDSTVIIVSPTEIYDWYGRPVKLDEQIKEVISSYGSNTRINDLENFETETFLARKRNGALTLAELLMEEPLSQNSISVSRSQQFRTGYQVGRKAVITPGDYRYFEFHKIDNSILKTPIMQLFLSAHDPYKSIDDYSCFAGIKLLDEKDSQRYSAIREGWHNCEWLSHRVASRKDIMNLSAKRSSSSQIKSQVFGFLCGTIHVSEDGTMLSSIHIVNKENGSPAYLPISTDIEVVQHMISIGETNSLWWYIDM